MPRFFLSRFQKRQNVHVNTGSSSRLTGNVRSDALHEDAELLRAVNRSPGLWSTTVCRDGGRRLDDFENIDHRRKWRRKVQVK